MKPFHFAAMLILMGATMSPLHSQTTIEPRRAAHLRIPPTSFYVATSGNDNWSGTLPAPNAGRTDGPFATLVRARDAVRGVKKAGGGVAVQIRGGTYPLEKGLELLPEDSGLSAPALGGESSPVVYMAYQDEEVHLLGGREIRGLKPVTDQGVLARLPEAARGKVLQMDLKAAGIKEFGEMQSRGFSRPTTPAALELFFNDQPMTIARYPSDAFLRIAGIPKDAGKDDGHGSQIGTLESGFYYADDRPSRWKDISDLWVHGYWAWDWANSYEKVESIDTERKLIKTRPPRGVYGFRRGQRFYFLNILEELDSPGEWYLDRKAGILYFWPPADVEKGRTVVSSLAEPMITLNGVSNVVLRGLTLECTRGHGIRIVKGRDDAAIGCRIRNVGSYGVWIEGGQGHIVAGCEIYGTGDGGVNVSGGDRKTLTPSGHLVHNNHFHHIGRWSKCYVPAVLVSGVGTRVSNNLIHDHPHCAILFTGNEHVIEFNEIHHVALETGDVGAIYTGRDWTYRGNVIRHNYLHDIGSGNMGGAMGVYMDDCVSGTEIYGNVFRNVQRAVFLGGGRDFKVRNNLFINCQPAVQIDGRGLDKRPVWHDMVYQTMRERLDDMNWKKPPYSARYPELADLEKYYQAEDGVPPGNILLECNISVGAAWLHIGWNARQEHVQSRDNLVGQDVRFFDQAGGDYRLKEDSPALKLGFQPIPFQRLGLIGDEYRPRPQQ